MPGPSPTDPHSSESFSTSAPEQSRPQSRKAESNQPRLPSLEHHHDPYQRLKVRGLHGCEIRAQSRRRLRKGVPDEPCRFSSRHCQNIGMHCQKVREVRWRSYSTPGYQADEVARHCKPWITSEPMFRIKNTSWHCCNAFKDSLSLTLVFP